MFKFLIKLVLQLRNEISDGDFTRWCQQSVALKQLVINGSKSFDMQPFNWLRVDETPMAEFAIENILHDIEHDQFERLILCGLGVPDVFQLTVNREPHSMICSGEAPQTIGDEALTNEEA